MASTYTMVQCLGRGGFGEVYLANATSHGVSKRVAVKVLKDGVQRDDALARLHDEAKMLGVLAHPAILSVIELTRLDGRVALVTEFVDGVDLSRFIKPDKLLPPRVAMSAIAEVAAALDVAWNTTSPITGRPLHLVHRDIKPDNIRLGRHGDIKLLDFGIARTNQLMRAAATVNGDSPFTPNYAPPEVYRDVPPGAHTDVFALGATLYRLLVGEGVYHEISVTGQVQLAAFEESFVGHIRARLALIEGDALRELLGQCLAYDPAARPTAREVQQRLERLADHDTFRARSTGPIRELPATRPVRRWPWIVGGLLLALIVVSFVGVGLMATAAGTAYLWW